MTSGRLVLILGCFGQLSAMNVSVPAEQLELEDRLLRVLARLRLEEEFNTLLVYGEECVFHSLLRHLAIPTVVVASGSTDFDWNYSSSTLILTCGLNADREENPDTLMKLQRSRRLLNLQDNTPAESVCSQYSLKEQHNVAMVKSNFDLSDIIYACRFFQTPNHREVHFFADQSIYIENFRNMRGAEIRTVPDMLVPRTMVYRDKKTGETRMMGYLANVVNNYVQKVNARLRILDVTELGVKKASVADTLRWAKEEILDIGTALVSSLQIKNMDIITYPYVLTGYCLMIPVPAKLPYNQVYSMIVDPLVLSIIFVLFCVFSILIVYTQNLSWRHLTLVNVLLNDKSLRGLLGQSFPFPPNPSKHLKLIIFVLCFASVMITTMYEAYLQSFFTQPPSEPYIRSFRDIAHFSFKLAISRIEVNIIKSVNNTDFREISEDHLLIYEDWAEYLVLRDSFNTSFIFPVSVDRWSGYEAQQELFAEPAFYLSDLCFNQLMFFSLPVRQFLPHRHLLEDHMMSQHEFGLVEFWKSMSFFDMVKLGLASIEDYSHKPQTEESLKMDDISWILKLYSAAMGLSICCFILEVSGCMERWERLWRCRRSLVQKDMTRMRFNSSKETMACLVILLLCLRPVRAQLLEISDGSEPDLEESLLHLLLRLRQEEFYDTLLVYGEDCVFHTLTQRLEVSTVLVSLGSTNYDWDFGSLTLILSCSPDAEKEETYRTLMKLQRNRRLIYLLEDIPFKSVCDYYAKKEQYNIAMVREDFVQSKAIYACRCFEDPTFREVNLLDNNSIYIENFKDMYGQPIRIMADLVAPRSMVYRNPRNGETKMIGYVANVINNFAGKLNATLEVQSLSGNVTFRDIIRRVKEDHIDMAMTLEASVHATTFDTASYPFVLTSYCLMLPIPAKWPYNLVYAMIVDHLVLGILLVLFCVLSLLLIYSKNMSWQGLNLANVLLNDISLRGLLGQSFPFPSNPSKQLRLIFLILCFASVMLTTMYEAYLQSFFTHPPSEPFIRSFEDIAQFQQTIAITTFKMNELTKYNNTPFQKIGKDNLKIFSEWHEYLDLRNAFNQSYGYLVTEDRWTTYAEQQKIFKNPLFYYSTDLCFSRLVFMNIPLRRHLPYRHLFEEHMVRQHEVGLVSFWKSRSFFDMVRLDLTPLEDFSKPKSYEASLLLDDVSWIMKLYLAAMLISIVCFSLEVLSKGRGWELGKYLKVCSWNSRSTKNLNKIPT